jgi:hypothetical protein
MPFGAVPISAAPALIAQVEAQDEANFTTAVNTLLAANPNVKVVVATLAEISMVPAARLAALTPQGQVLVAAVSASIARYDALVAAEASNPRVALVDLASATSLLASSPTGTFTYGGATINLLTPGDDYHDFFLADGIHVGTVGESIIANLFVQSVDSKFGAGLAPISPRLAVRYAQAIGHRAV